MGGASEQAVGKLPPIAGAGKSQGKNENCEPRNEASSQDLLRGEHTSGPGALPGEPFSSEPGTPQQSGARSARRSEPIPRALPIHKIDAFATPVVQGSAAGGTITILVYLALTAYIIFLVIQWNRIPPTKVNTTEWTIGVGPYPMPLTCVARSGCLVSNVLSFTNTLGISAYVSPEQTLCMSLAFNASMTVDVVFSVDPTEGLSVMWDPATAVGTTSLTGAGLTVVSDMACLASSDAGCLMLMATPITAGTVLLQYVDTTNDTATGLARHRREWFANTISADGQVLPGSTPCYNPLSPDPEYARWVQARLRTNSFYNVITVSRDTFWMFLFGAVGGAYALFLQMGGLLLSLIGITWAMHTRWLDKRRVGSAVHGDNTAHRQA